MAAPTPISTEDESVEHKVDTFSSIALKYEFVFGLSKASRILLLGPYFQSISQDLRRHFAAVHFAASSSDVTMLAADNRYDLIGLDACSDWTERRVEELIITARSRLAHNGTLVVVATNRLSIDRLLAKLRRRAVGTMHGLTLAGYKNALAAVGLTGIAEFMVLPSLRTADEYVATTHGDIELPTYVSLLHKIVHRLRLYRYVHGDFLYIAREDAGGGLNEFSEQVGRQIASHGLTYGPLYLERFDLRDRGALILMLSDRAKRHRFVARVAASHVVNSVISKNTSFTDRIHSLGTLDARTKGLVPKTIATFEYRDCPVYVENRIPGVLVWKVGGDRRIEKRAYRQSYDFINAFNLATAREMTVDSVLFDDLVGHDLSCIKSAMVGLEGIGGIVNNIELQLRQYFTGRQVSTVWGHGDFGYGNILCDPSSGNIQGVIDWDTHVLNELPGVDFCNLVLQKSSRDFDGDVARALEEMSRTIERSGVLDITLPQYGKGVFHFTAQDYEICLCLAGIRMIKRSIPYQKEFSLRKAGYAKILAVAERILTKAMARNSPAMEVHT